MLTLALKLMAIPRPRIRLRRGLGLLLAIAALAYVLYVVVGSNSHAVIAGRVFRTSQLGGDSLAEYLKSKQIRTVINLRGHCPDFAWYREEAAACVAAGANQEDITLSANRLPPPTELRRLIEVFDRTEYPIVLHCKQGADRTGLASAIVLLLYSDATLARAKRELWPHRGHFPVARTIAMDQLFERYETWLGSEPHTPQRFRDWAMNHYTPGPAMADLQLLTPIPESVAAGQPFAFTLRATNRSSDSWRMTPGKTAGIHLQYRVYDSAGVLAYEDVAGLVRRTIAPGESIDLLLAFPRLKPGAYTLRAEMADFEGAGLAVRAKYFYQFGSEAMLVPLNVK